MRWSGLVTNHHYFLLLSQTYVLGNVRSELFLVYGCQLFMFLCCFYFYFFTTDIYTFIYFTLFLKGIWYLKCTSVFTCYLQNGDASVFFHLLNTILGLRIFNAYSKYFITECEWFKFCCNSALIQETHLKQSDVAHFQNKYYKLEAFPALKIKLRGCLSLLTGS